jgi:small-conductance mechanosensitive channel
VLSLILGFALQTPITGLIGNAKGDVIDVSYLDTILWDFGGPYSWPLFPYIWNEIKFQVAYDSDLDFITRTMQEVVEEELGRK